MTPILLELNYDEWKISGVSHLYGIFSFCHYCLKHGIELSIAKQGLHSFYAMWGSKEYDTDLVKEYKESIHRGLKIKGKGEEEENHSLSFADYKMLSLFNNQHSTVKK